jgi:hypothetical protein
MGWLLIAALSILATQQLRAAKGRIQARHYAANTYGSPQYNRARQATPRRLAPEALNGSAECAPCHPVPFQQWEVSAHAYAVKNRPFQAIAKALIERHGLEFVRDCATCHEPALAFSDRLDLLVDPEYLKRSEGVSCRACHAIDWSAERNGIYRVQLPRADGVFTDVSARAKFMKLAVMEHVSDFTKPNIVSGQTCFGCHSLRAKRAGHWVVPLDNVTSFRKSSFALEKNLKCHDCHMPRIEKDDFSYSWRDHRLFGSHLLLDRMSFETQPETLAKLRKLTEANNDFLFAKLHTLDQVPAFMDETFKTYRFFNYLKGWRKVAHVKAANSGGAAFIARLEDVALERGADGPQLAFTVRLSNPALGHDFPSSLFANLVRVWTECTLTDRGGRVLLQTSYQADDYTRQLGRIEVADDGRPILPPESLDYNRLVNLKYILPDAGYADRYRVTTPPDAQWPLQLSLQLKYRRYDAPQLAGAGDPQTQGLPDFTLLDYRTAIERPAEARR